MDSNSDVLAIIPARTGSKGIPGKNFRRLDDGMSPVEMAIACVDGAGIPVVYVSTDDAEYECYGYETSVFTLLRPRELAQDDTPMVEVIKHALAEIPGPEDQIILLVQPTQPLRKPEHLTAAVKLLQESGADSVVSVVELPLDLSPEMLCRIGLLGRLRPWDWDCEDWPGSRQNCDVALKRDGTCYAFRRRTLARFGNIYGKHIQPMRIPASESCALDTPEDWVEAERRLIEREHGICGNWTPAKWAEAEAERRLRG